MRLVTFKLRCHRGPGLCVLAASLSAFILKGDQRREFLIEIQQLRSVLTRRGLQTAHVTQQSQLMSLSEDESATLIINSHYRS